MNEQTGIKTRAFRAALPYTLPICAGFLFLGLAYGLLMKSQGFSFVWPMLMSMTIFAGSMEFIVANLLLSAFHPLSAFLLTLLVNARHLFYGVAMLDRYRGTGWKKFFLIFGMCDESFSINCTAEPPEGVDKPWFMLFVTLLNYIYWVGVATLGGLAGSLLTINTEGLDFVMPALFVVIFLNQWRGERNHIPSVIGLGASVFCLLIFGANDFIVPAMAAILALLTLARPRLEKGEDTACK